MNNYYTYSEEFGVSQFTTDSPDLILGSGFTLANTEQIQEYLNEIEDQSLGRSLETQIKLTDLLENLKDQLSETTTELEVIDGVANFFISQSKSERDLLFEKFKSELGDLFDESKLESFIADIYGVDEYQYDSVTD